MQEWYRFSLITWAKKVRFNSLNLDVYSLSYFARCWHLLIQMDAQCGLSVPNILLSLFMCCILGGCHSGRCSSLFLDLPPRFDPPVPFELVGHSFRVSGSVNVAPRYCINQITGGRLASCDYSTCIIRGLLNSKRKKRCYL